MSLWRDKFEAYISKSGRILDAGCGSGRDSHAFKQHGYSVVAFDASTEMCRMASKLIRQKVLLMRFDGMDFEDEFDGVWACSSLLHVSYEDLIMSNQFLTNYTGTTFLDKIKDNLRHCTSFDFSVSFIKKAGLVLLYKDIEAAVERGCKGRIITSTYQNFTDMHCWEDASDRVHL
jgi:SAM-dependent methyltransferase